MQFCQTLSREFLHHQKNQQVQQYDFVQLRKQLTAKKLNSYQKDCQNPPNANSLNSIEESDKQNDSEIFICIIEKDHLILNIEYSVVMILNKKLNQIKLKIYFSRNNTFIKISDKPQSLLMCRYFNKINSSLKYGHFRLNPLTRQFYLDVTNVYSNKQYKQLVKDVRAVKKCIQQQINQFCRLIQKYLLRILYMIGEIDEIIIDTKIIQYQQSKNGNSAQFKFKLVDRKENSSLQDKEINKFRIQEIQMFKLITKITRINVFQYTFMYNHVLNKKMSNKQQKKRLKQAEESFNNTTNYNTQKYKQQLLNYEKSIKLIQKIATYQQQWIGQLQQMFVRYLTLPFAKVSNTVDNTKLFTNIIIQSIQESKQKIGESGFCQIYRMRIKFAYEYVIKEYMKSKKPDDMRQLQKYLKNLEQEKKLVKLVAVKEQKQTYEPNQKNMKIKHQKKILEQIKDQSCVNITKFYQTKQTEFNLKPTLIMDFYMFRSFDCYINSNLCTLSLMTKVYLLCQVLQGLRFLRDNKIVHLDMKPQNILIGKGLLLRLTDFGQSYHPSACKNNFSPGFSIPYVAPQIFSDKPDYNQKSDVYSLGVVMFEIFFSKFFLEISKVNSDKLVEYYQELMKTSPNFQNTKIMVSEYNLGFYGPDKLMQTLAYLCLKCAKVKQSQRPLLDWILIQLRESINFLDKFY